ncbi:MAG TPA: hypothetical protein VKE24_06445, partial [Candidatus Acidoferrales bacterium]|nr:hypothetical protein [Candidatus Acidoferrales bacterium]
MPRMLRTVFQTWLLAVLGLLAFLPRHIAAQETKPALIMTVPAAELRTLPSFFEPILGAEETAEIPFLPENAEEYARLKDEADRERDLRGPVGRFQIEPSPFLPVPDIGIEGLNQEESPVGVFLLFPPDTHGAVGPTQ